ncbi:MAG: TMEM165/GDT1 family protein [Actinomycetota bacterium]
MIADAAVALVVVFVAELGDKTQLVALSLSARYRTAQILGALGATIVVLQTLSVAAGSLIGESVDPDVVGAIAGLMFIAFGVWSWREAMGDPSDAGGEERPAGTRGLVAVAAAFFVAELGDKTMLTTAGLAADRDAVGVWVGSTLAMLAATWIAVVAGVGLVRRIGRRRLQLGGAIVFVVIGVVTLLGAAL